MKEILKPIFEWLIGNYNLFDNVIYNYIAMTIVGLLAFNVAWKIVGDLYHFGAISGRAVGSIIHWTVRFIAFVVIFSLVSTIIWIIKLIITIPDWVWWISLGIISMSIIGIGVIFFCKRKIPSIKVIDQQK